MSNHNYVTRRSFLGSVAAASMVPSVFAQTPAHIPVLAWNHMTLSVTDIQRSLDFYQGLFGLTIAARQAQTLVLRLGNGPQFMALGGGRPDVTTKICHVFFNVRSSNFLYYSLVNPLPRFDSFAEAEFKTKFAVETDGGTSNF